MRFTDVLEKAFIWGLFVGSQVVNCGFRVCCIEEVPRGCMGGLGSLKGPMWFDGEAAGPWFKELGWWGGAS